MIWKRNRFIRRLLFWIPWKNFSSTDYSKLDDDRAWSSQEWKIEATMYDRPGRLDKTSWIMVWKVRLGFGKYFKNNCQSIENTKDLTLTDKWSTRLRRLVSEQHEISGLETNGWENHFSWKYLSLICDEQNHQSSSHAGVRLFKFCIASWKMNENTQSNDGQGRKIRMVRIISCLQKLSQWVNGIRVEYLPRIQYVAAQSRRQTFTVEIRWDTREFYKKISFFMSKFNDISWGSWDNKVECESNAQLVSPFARRFWSRTMVIPRTWIRESVTQLVKTVHKENGTEMQSKWCWHLQQANTQFSESSVQRSV